MLAKGAIALAEHSVADSSYKQYKVAWGIWKDFMEEFNADHTLASMLYDDRVTHILAFIFKKFHEDRLRCSTINSYLAGIQHFLKLGMGNDMHFLHDTRIEMAKKGMEKAEIKMDKEWGRPNRKIPFTLDLILETKKIVNTSTTYGLSIYTSMIMAYMMLLRVSEYTVSEHCIRTTDVRFWTTGGRQYDGIELNAVLFERVESVSITLRSAKNDQSGIGNTAIFPNRGGIQTGISVCSLLFNWCKYHGPRQDHYLFGSLTAQTINKYIKLGASRHGISPSLVSSHQIRHAATTALHAGGLPSHTIQSAGRWSSSESMKHYAHMSMAMFTKIEQVLGNPSVLTAADIMKQTHTQYDDSKRRKLC